MLEKKDVIREEASNQGTDLLISSETAFKLLSEVTGRNVVGFVDEPTINGFWLEIKEYEIKEVKEK